MATSSVVSTAGPGTLFSYTGSTFSLEICPWADFLHFCLQPQMYPKRKNEMEVRKKADTEDSTTSASINSSLFAVTIKIRIEKAISVLSLLHTHLAGISRMRLPNSILIANCGVNSFKVTLRCQTNEQPSIVSLEAMIKPLGESKGGPQFTR